MRNTTLVAALSAFAMPAIAANKAPSNDELYEIVQAQQEQIEQLVGQRGTSEGKTMIGGYGELHYNNLDNKKMMDFHRFVLFFNHAFNERVRFFSELELEHSLAGEGKPGEVELEQAYIEFDVTDNTRVKGGLFLIPIGILNETHEPPTFYGVERNPIESALIPTTWWEGGAGISGNLGASGISYDLAVHSALDIDPTTYKVRDGRQKVASADAEELATSARLKYTGIAGLELAATVYAQGDVTQDPAIDGGAGTLLETHARWNNGPLTLTALYASWTFDSEIAKAQAKDKQDGYYVEGSWRFNEQFGVFTRYNVWDNGGVGETEKTQTNVGFNYWPHRNVVVKFDVQSQGKNPKDGDGFNLGIGYQF